MAKATDVKTEAVDINVMDFAYFLYLTWLSLLQ